MKPINVLSLFGGIECGRVALERLGVPVENYFSSEIDPYAMEITKNNYPEIIHIGGVTGVEYAGKSITWNNRSEYFTDVKIDLLIGGSPCQDLSAAKANGQGLAGEKSGLFFEYVRILQETKPKYFLLENVASMKKADKDEITRIMGVEPILINSALVSAQNRKRLYWTNIPGITQPEDREIFLKDILEDIPADDPQWRKLDDKYITDPVKLLLKEKAYALTATYPGACPRDYIEKASRQLIIGQFRRTSLRVHADQEKVCTLTANMGTGGNNVPIVIGEKANTILASYAQGAYPGSLGTYRERTIVGMALRNRGEGKAPEFNGTEKANSLTTVQTDSVISDGYYWRKLTPIECERLQTLPDGYTDNVSATRRYKAIGNGWTVDVIAHILSFIKEI